MTVSVTVRSSPEVKALVRKLDAAAAGKLRRDITVNVRRAAQPIPAAIRRNILRTMPHSGGLAAALAGAQFQLRPLNFGTTAGVRLLVSSPMDEAAIDKGTVRHPLYGNTGFWYSERVPALVFTKPVRAARTDIVGAVDDAVRDNLT